MKHGRYEALVWYSRETGRFHGKVTNIPPRDLVLLEGATVEEIYDDFAGAIEDYEEISLRWGQVPETMYPNG